MTNTDASFAVACSYLGLTARDLADIGNFSERFARDLLAGRRSFPRDVQNTLKVLLADLTNIQQVMIEQAETDDRTIYIYRTLEQLRSSPVGKIWRNAYLGPYRVAAFQAVENCRLRGRTIHLKYATFPANEEYRDNK